MPTLKFTIVGRYEADYEGAASAQDMADMDQDEFDSGAVDYADILQWPPSERDITVKFEVES